MEAQPITGFTLELEGREDDLGRVLKAVWGVFMDINRERAVPREEFGHWNGLQIRFTLPDPWAAPTGTITYHRKEAVPNEL